MPNAVLPRAGCHARSWVPWAALLLALASGVQREARAQQYELDDEPQLAATISESDVELKTRFARQWTAENGERVVLMSGDFQLTLAGRTLSAKNAVVWIAAAIAPDTQRRYHALTVYLSEYAEVREPGGTITLDEVLLVRGLRTYGKIIKYQDAHLVGASETSPLYQQALRDRMLVEGQEGGLRVESPLSIRRPGQPERRRAIRYRLSRIDPAQTPQGERVFVSTGGVYFSQDGGPDAPLLEIRAQNAVVFPAEDLAESVVGQALEGRERGSTAPDAAGPAPAELRDAAAPDGAEVRRGGLLGLDDSAGPGQVRSVYLEGDVVLSLGNRMIRAHRLYYDFERERAVILDAVFRAEIPERGIPLYLRADEIRQLSAREFSAENARVTTSEFFTPHYHIGAERVVLRDVTPRDTQGQAVSPLAGEYEMWNTTLNVGGVPLLWWPYSKGRLEQTETLLRSLRTGYGSRYGFEFESRWSLFGLLGVLPPPGFDATLRLDYLSRRGPAVGIDSDYETKDYYGLLRTYFIQDDGKDKLGPLRKSEEDPSSNQRGRVLWRHRHYLPDQWEVTLELSYISDPYFLEEYEESEWFEGKEQETLIYLKRAVGNEAITLLANWRLLDFVTQTEHLPDLAYRRIGDTFLDPVVSYTEARFGLVRFQPDDRHFFNERRYTNEGRSDLTVRADARQEFELPLKLAGATVVPFASLRGTYWDGQPMDTGALWRGMGIYGVRGGASFSRVFDDVRSELLDIDRIRHIIQPHYVAWWGHSNERSSDITPFDYGIETIDAFYGAAAGVRQTWQTKRGPPGNQRTVDLLTLNLEVGAFGDTDERRDFSNGWVDPLRPEQSRTRNYLAGDLVYRLSDSTSLLYDFNFDLNDRSFDRHNVSLTIERNPRLAYVLGARYAGDLDMSLVGGGFNYKLNEKHITAMRAWFDVDTGRLGEVTFSYIRKLPRWYVGLNLEYDQVDDDFSVSLSLWPEGVPEWALGSRRFTKLSTSTGIRP